MTAQQYLDRVSMFELFIKSNQREIEKLNVQATGLSGKGFDERIQSSKRTSILDSILDRIALLREKIEKDTENYYSSKIEAWDAINSVKNEDERLVLRMRYIEGMKFKDISKEMHRSERGIYNIHKRALEKIEIPESVQ